MWVYLANLHFCANWLPTLEKEIENIYNNVLNDASKDSQNFKLWMSSAPYPQFPISILQKSMKVSVEPAKTIRKNMSKL